MRLAPTLLVVAVAAGAASVGAPAAHAGGLPVCNAKHKRPANPYGSVLSEGLKPALAAAPVVGARPVPKDAVEGQGDAARPAKPQRISRAEWRASLAPCGRGRA